jgi:hypothetical protein
MRVQQSFTGESRNIRIAFEMGIDADQRLGPKATGSVDFFDLRCDIRGTELGE